MFPFDDVIMVLTNVTVLRDSDGPVVEYEYNYTWIYDLDSNLKQYFLLHETVYFTNKDVHGMV